MGQCRGHLAHGGQPRHVDQFRLQLLQPRLGFLPFGKVADEAGEEAPLARLHLPHRQLHRKGGTVAPFADHHPADADDPPFAGGDVTGKIGVVAVAVGYGHQDADIAADRLVGGVAEQPLGGGAERLDDALFVDDHHRLGDGGEIGAGEPHGSADRGCWPRLRRGLGQPGAAPCTAPDYEASAAVIVIRRRPVPLCPGRQRARSPPRGRCRQRGGDHQCRREQVGGLRGHVGATDRAATPAAIAIVVTPGRSA